MNVLANCLKTSVANTPSPTRERSHKTHRLLWVSFHKQNISILRRLPVSRFLLQPP